MKNIVIISLVSASLLFSCKAQKETDNSQPKAEEVVKEKSVKNSAMSELSGAYIVYYLDELPEMEEVVPTITIDAFGKISGKNGCNSFFGNLNLEEGEKLIDKLGSTRMLCNGMKNDVEQRMMELMGKATKIVANDGTLELMIEDKTVIKAKKASLDGQWRVSTIGENIMFSINEYRMEGTTGCNNFSAQMEQGTHSFSVAINEVVYTELVCKEIDAATETKFLNSLDKVTRYQLEGNKVTFFYNNETLFSAVREG